MGINVWLYRTCQYKINSLFFNFYGNIVFNVNSNNISDISLWSLFDWQVNDKRYHLYRYISPWAEFDFTTSVFFDLCILKTHFEYSFFLHWLFSVLSRALWHQHDWNGYISILYLTSNMYYIFYFKDIISSWVFTSSYST